MSSEEQTLYYCFGRAGQREHVDSASWAIEDFLPQEGSLTLFSTYEEAWYGMQSRCCDSNSDILKFNIVCCVKLHDNALIKKVRINEESLLTVNVKNLIPLYANGAATSLNNHRYSVTEYRYTEAYISDYLLQETAINDDNKKMIRAILKIIFSIKQKYSLNKNIVLKQLEQQSLLLIVKQYEKHCIYRGKLFDNIVSSLSRQSSLSNDLTNIFKGLRLSKNVLEEATPENIKALQSFASEEALGKTNYWLIYGGALLAVIAALALPITLVFISATAIPAPLGGLLFIDICVVVMSCAISKSGFEDGFATLLGKVSNI